MYEFYKIGCVNMARFIIFLDRVVNLYLYYVVMACFLSLVPNINFDYPLFDFIFKSAGFYIIPPIFGVSFSVMFVMMALVLVSVGLKKIYLKYYAKDEPQIVILSKEEFEKTFGKVQSELEKDKKDDSD
jgi:uncharacterized protein YggT (Ycf19 family)